MSSRIGPLIRSTGKPASGCCRPASRQASIRPRFGTLPPEAAQLQRRIGQRSPAAPAWPVIVAESTGGCTAPFPTSSELPEPEHTTRMPDALPGVFAGAICNPLTALRLRLSCVCGLDALQQFRNQRDGLNFPVR
jgi:hypothetical protein